jgi:PPP family 3-phenylpropionic acid transporter
MRIPAVRLSVLYFGFFIFIGAYTPYFSLYLQALGQSPMQIAVLLSLMQFMRIFAPHAWAGAADRRGNHASVLRLSLALAALSWCGLFLARGYWQLFLVLALVGFFTSAALPLAETLTFAHLRADFHRYGRIRVWGSIGFIAAVLGIGAVLDAAPVSALLPLGLLALLLALAAAGTTPEAPAAERQGAEQPAWRLLLRPDIATLFAACFLMCMAHGSLYTFYSIYLAEHGYSKSLVGVLWALGVLAEVLVFMLMPRLFRRWTPRAVLAFSFACAIVRFSVIGWAIDILPLVILAQLLHAATFGSYHAAALALVNGYFPAGQRSRGQALFTSLTYGAGGMAGGLVSGLAWQSWGPAWTFSVSSFCAGLGFTLLVYRPKPGGLLSKSA